MPRSPEPAYGAGLKQRVDEWRHSSSLGEHQQGAEQQHQRHHGQQPKFLALSQESPKFTQKHHSFLLKLSSHAARRRTRWFPLDPIAVGLRIKAKPERILSETP